MNRTSRILTAAPARRPPLGVGLGLRSAHFETILSHKPEVSWFEATSENYMGPRGGSGGRPLEVLETVRRDYPIALHGVSMNIGSEDPLRLDYLENLQRLIERIEPIYVSDHLCWTGVGGENLHDLLPLPFTEEAVRHVVSRIRHVQDFLGRRVLFENVSSYTTFAGSEMAEWDFLAEVAARADCGLLLDVNNVYVNARNHSFDPAEYLKHIPVERVAYLHLAGYSESQNFLIDTHGNPVAPPVWALYRQALRLWGDAPTLIEWDEDVPPFGVLHQEARKAEQIRQSILKEIPRDARAVLAGAA